ncbi:pilus assembly protein [Shewanella amazonensis]|uniref:Type IV pilin biogenesis protein, putative n=1 Tax=Shewanella amazonensis (strain ATCC BAA-1098 / SB2B) TaxID=326297 RepID=A1S432_SHEAM|nr:PilC/PilY family type IV pilus protein [Shewanella amazonensis]ABL99138.1 type IV pilin biogenesis protein, putative [Shewanella amazonensis SB2B]
MKFNQILFAGLVTASVLPAQSFADDTDLYLNPAANNVRPQVLIIFDNSGSMDTIVDGVAGGYDPNYTQEDGTLGYPAVGSSNSYQGRMIYFTVGTGMDESSLPVPDSPSESRRFNDFLNGCKAARDALNQYGRFTGYIREFITKGKGNGTWQPIKENSGAERNNPIDCWEDIESEYNSNNDDGSDYKTGYPVGFPRDGDVNNPWGSDLDSAKNLNWNNGELVTLYTDNYLRWYTLYKNGSLPVPPDGEGLTRLEIAKSAISGVISSIPSVDFGLAIYNLNFPDEGDSDGGRIVAGIRQRTAAEKDTMLSTISNLPAQTNTPLCETLFEAYRYFSGGPITFGHADADYNGKDIKYSSNKPMYDASIENGANYITPLSECNKVAHIIYITDGAPVLDESANDYIKELGGEPYEYKAASGDQEAKVSYLPALAEYMFANDLLPDVENKQRVVTHTIGFSLGEDSEAEPLLVETASRSYLMTSEGKKVFGTYRSADDVAGLQEAISNIIDSIPQTGQRFSAPGVAFSNADPTRTLDSAYYALFRPQQSPKWAGNLKKLKVNSSGTLVDSTGKPAIDSSGGIAESSCSLWSNCTGGNDGNDVVLGGAARTIVPDSRIIWSDIDSSEDMDKRKLTVQNASSYVGGDDALATYLGLPKLDVDSELKDTFDWIYGKNVDRDSEGALTSEDFAGVRGDIMGDPLHSQPLAIDYGGDGSNVRIFVGTNHGALHAFRDSGSSVSESWAFMPFQLLPNLATIRRDSYLAGHSVYGIDGSPVAHIERNASGLIMKAWLFVGLRRGGQSYYAINITEPDSPKLMWHISNSTSEFSNMGQTWSTPVVTKIPGSEKPVVIFGGGYNQGYDSGDGSNSVGRMVYLVDAESGSLLYSFGANGNTVLTGIEDSIVGSIATLDSNSDGYTDRLYAADLGGNVWRMDLPSADKSTWSGFKFAELGGNLPSTDRRFFYEPSVAQTYFTNTTEVTVTDESGTTTTVAYQNVPYDAVTLGSGNRADPLSLNAEDMFFVLQDRNVVSQQFGDGATAIPSPITFGNLYDVTSAAPSTEAENITFGTKLGWYYNFAVTGEKSLSPSVIIKGKVYFTSFIPTQPAAGQNVCSVSSVGRLYTLDLHKGSRYNEAYIIDVCDNCIPQPPKIITPPPCDTGEECSPDEILNPPPPVLIIGKGKCDENGENCSGTVDLESGLTTNKIYYHIDE